MTRRDNKKSKSYVDAPLFRGVRRKVERPSLTLRVGVFTATPNPKK
jgi:hypothetical protein